MWYHPCSRLKYYNTKMHKIAEQIKKDIVFVGLEGHKPEDAGEDSLDIKYEMEDVDIHDNSNSLEDNSDDIYDQNNVSNEKDPNSEELVSINSFKNEYSPISYEFLEEYVESTESSPESLEKYEHVVYRREMSDDEDHETPLHLRKPEPTISTGNTENTHINPKKYKIDMGYEGQMSDEEDYETPLQLRIQPVPTISTGNTENTPVDTKKYKKDMGYKGQMSDDEDYIPPPFLRTSPRSTTSKEIIVPKHKQTTENTENKSKNYNQSKTKDEDYVPPPNLIRPTISTIQLENYSRTTIIGRCIFTDCIEDCISLIPRIVRRKMVIEHNVYIPRLSKVCSQHLQDQNWEDISKTTTIFRPDHCQDMKNITTEASHTNFDFENIDTVDSKLVRYWFDLNKGQFNRIFDYFLKLKRLKEPKTAFAVYLMHLQNTSHKRIGLLLKMKERAVKKRIRFVQDIVKCSTFKSFKEKFLEEDD